MTSSPAAPESETPLTEAIVARWEKIAAASPGSLSRDELESLMKQLASEFTASHYQLERAFSLAQTEIKGHARREEDLKVRIAELEETRAVLKSQMDDWLAENHKTLAARDNAIARADEAQARIAELEKAACCPDEQFERMEKDAARYRWLRREGEAREEAFLFIDETMDRFVDAALKSRT